MVKRKDELFQVQNAQWRCSFHAVLVKQN